MIKTKYFKYFLTLGLCLLFYNQVLAQYPVGSPVSVNGKLSVSGNQMVNECGNVTQLRGMSSHGPQWFKNCYSDSSLDALVDDWGIDVFRLAMYVEEDGYVNDPSFWKEWIDEMVDACEARGIYCLIDWHVLTPGDPNANLEAARDFWSYMSAKHTGKEHVIYEIANEPNGVSWSTVKSYADDIIPRIRANDPNTIVIVGTPTWSQDVDVAAADPLNYSNLMYALHFYTGTHTSWLRDKANTALQSGLALFVTEFGTSLASGDGGPFLDEGQLWMDWMHTNNISWANWTFSDAPEVSAALNPGACNGGDWNNTTESGTFIKENLSSPADNFQCNNSETVYSIFASAGEEGSITPSGNWGVTEGNDQTFSISFNNGFAIDQVIVDGANVGSVESYTFSNVQTNHTIAVTYKVGEIIRYAYPDGVPHAIPGAVASVNFDVGGEGIAYHDETLGNVGTGPRQEENVDTEFNLEEGNVGWIDTGEWLEYTVNVTQSGDYSIAVQVASLPGGGAFHIEFDGADVTGVQSVSSTGGWDVFASLNISNISLVNGEHVMRVYSDIGLFNLGSMTFTTSSTGGNNDPVAVVSTSALTGLAPLQVSFDASGSTDIDGDVLSYAWNFGDNVTDTGSIVNHTYTNAGSYSATVTVSDGEGGEDQESFTISVSDDVGGNNDPVAIVSTSALTGLAPLNVSFDASGSTDIDGDVLSYTWDFGDNVTATGSIVDHTYTSAGNYSATVTVTDGQGGIDQESFAISVTNDSDGSCSFGTPLQTALPSGNNSYNNVHVIGSGGPDLSQVTIFTINWDLANNGLWQMSMNTNNGSPSWWIDLRNSMTSSFNTTLPEMTFSGTGFSGLDGSYYVNFDGGNFVMVSKTADHSIYFSNDTDAPTCDDTNVRFTSKEDQSFADYANLNVYPNPSKSGFSLLLENLNTDVSIELFDLSGQRVKDFEQRIEGNKLLFGEDLYTGVYFLKVDSRAIIKVVKN